ncbi:MAG: DUF4238 domain-containing protein [Clostridiales bacterium]|nr:DUF4238 domain-containing protein [Clostridiales bacterium]
MKEKKNTIRSHYIPQTYLKHFLLDDKLFMYKKGENFFKRSNDSEKRILEVRGVDALKNIGLENNIYKLNIGSFNSDDIEDIFREYGENFFDDVVSKIDQIKEGEEINFEIREKICIFMGAMLIRTPFFKKQSEDIDSSLRKYFTALSLKNEDLKRIKKDLIREGKKYSIKELSIAKQRLIDGNYELQYPNEFFIKVALSSLEQYINIFREMKMVIFKNKEARYFITSDNPVVYFVPREKVNFYNPYKSLVSKHTEVFFPVTKNLAIFLSRRDNIREVLQYGNRGIVDLFNENISHNSLNFLFSPLKMNKLKKFVEEYIPYPFEIRIY